MDQDCTLLPENLGECPTFGVKPSALAQLRRPSQPSASLDHPATSEIYETIKTSAERGTAITRNMIRSLVRRGISQAPATTNANCANACNWTSRLLRSEIF